jgi:hypothetical protein
MHRAFIDFCSIRRIKTMRDNPDNLDDGGLQDLGRLPVSIQTFLWRQIAPFVRPKLGKLHEANCMVRK